MGHYVPLRDGGGVGVRGAGRSCGSSLVNPSEMRARRAELGESACTTIVVARD